MLIEIFSPLASQEFSPKISRGLLLSSFSTLKARYIQALLVLVESVIMKELLRQLSYEIKIQLKAPKAEYFFVASMLGKIYKARIYFLNASGSQHFHCP